MENAVALIDKLIKEHKVIIKDAQSLEQVANDARMLEELAGARETFVPGRFDQKQSLQKLQESLKAIDKGLREHFDREETGLLAAFEQHGAKKLITAFNDLLIEHKDLRDRMAHAKEHVAGLVSGGDGSSPVGRQCQ